MLTEMQQADVFSVFCNLYPIKFLNNNPGDVWLKTIAFKYHVMCISVSADSVGVFSICNRFKD